MVKNHKNSSSGDTSGKSYDFSRLTVLLIEDNVHMRNLVKDMLRAFGVGRIIQAMDGTDGLSVMKDDWVDVVITDWMMEPLDGYDFIKLVRTADDLRRNDIPVIMLTGHTSARHVRAARDAGVTEFLAKPVSPGALFDRLVYIIEKPRSFVRAPKYVGPDRRRKMAAEFDGRERRTDKLADSHSTLTPDEVDALLNPD